ncbi:MULTISPECIES: enoyl-CoA hydratase/isomerase family protein [unclassified Streptomyces]|jgi:enoyl-CoA hydratase/carnithine racemase|uniref:enoyl-CoA hydratase/isomerase family protein n=1 Tax=unclassified Streptomyces TaxID=2593676 RepID=UPI000F4F0ABF|nr:MULTISPECIES: enoyl-CoA hydratase/isomerase family protein [unclassified Streptomyces]MDH6454464.1 enoyl-CoA hydratase/carnithine racemase [Streptomyces sp. SAI-119]MDH6494978.1 enoyl-CoA hydratase/carnithine racemase [Streptomyces sp. SAI-149]QUC57897.1 enoyl-CoA hydratase/isomerase family protein [Streptomyces sp. A2-16]
MELPDPQLLHTVVDSVATVVVHHPAKRNAMTAAMWRALPPLLDTLAADPDVRVLVLTGEGGTFCAGADISTLRQGPEEAQGLAVGAEEALAAFPKPTLAAIRGHCVGGGSQLAAACDLRFAEQGALFGVTPAKLGIVYPASSTRRLVSLVGPATAKYLLFSGELIDAERALRTGLVDEVLPGGELAARVAEFARILASRSQLTQAAAKEFANGRTDRDAHWTAQARDSGDTAEGVAAFLERRTPRFTWTTSG